MQTNGLNNNSKVNLWTRLLGAPTPAKASGLAFSFVAVFPTVLAFVFLIVVSALGLTQTDGYASQDWYLYANFLLPQLAFAVAAFCYLKYVGMPVKQAVQKQKCHPKYYLIALLLQIGLLSLSELNGLFLKLLGELGYQDAGISLPSLDGFGLVGVLFVVALLPAVFEETVFRGVLLSGLKAFGKTGAILLCGGLFALYHQNPAQTAYQFCCGAAFALVALKAGSILPTALAHFLNNATVILFTKFGVNGFPTPILIALIITSAVCLLGTLSYLLFFDNFDKKTKENSLKTEEKGEKKRFFLTASVGIAVCFITWISVLIAGL